MKKQTTHPDMAKIELNPGERVDDLERNGYLIIQKPGRFSFGMDAVLLSSFARAARGDRVLDLGTGTGVIPILMAAKTDCSEFVGLEISDECADMARRSVAFNDLEDKITIVNGDIREAARIFESASFDVIVTNPPYLKCDGGKTGTDDARAISRHEIMCTLEDVTGAAGKLLKRGGHFFMVHRPVRLAGIFTSMATNRLEPKKMRLVYSYSDREANLVLIEGIKDAGAGLTVEKPLIIYDDTGNYSSEVRGMYDD